MKHRYLLMLVVYCATSIVMAQGIRIGVVVDRSGPVDSAIDAAIAAFELRIQSEGGVFGTDVEVLVRDGRGEPAATAAALDLLVTEHHVHALICCQDERSAGAGAAAALAHGVPVLTLAPSDAPPNPWWFGIGPDDRTELRAIVGHVYAEGKRAIGLMTLDHAFGDLPERVLTEELAVAGMDLVVVERYPPNVDVLTPEALWVATRQPGAVVVWGLARDTHLAVEALRQRGYMGPIYVRADLLSDPSAGIDPAVYAGARFAVAPILVDDATAATPESEAAARLKDVLFGLYGVREVSKEAARTYDALDLLRAAAEQAATYGVSPTDAGGYRLALRDAAIALPAFTGAAGIYDLQEAGGQAALPRGLAVVELRDSRLVAVLP